VFQKVFNYFCRRLRIREGTIIHFFLEVSIWLVRVAAFAQALITLAHPPLSQCPPMLSHALSLFIMS
jgi:hypothetical protein